MGVVVHEVCPSCKQSVYMALQCPQMRCPNCKKVDIINSKRKKRAGATTAKRENRYSFKSYTTVSVSCPKCGTNFTSSPALKKGKIFCPNCSNPITSHQEEE